MPPPRNPYFNAEKFHIYEIMDVLQMGKATLFRYLRFADVKM